MARTTATAAKSTTTRRTAAKAATTTRSRKSVTAILANVDMPFLRETTNYFVYGWDKSVKGAPHFQEYVGKDNPALAGLDTAPTTINVTITAKG